MAEEKTVPQPAVQEEVKGCTGDCKHCVNDQRIYCAAQISYYVNNAIGQMVHAMEQQSKAITELNDKITVLTDELHKKNAAGETHLVSAPEPAVAGSERKSGKKGK